MGTIVGIGEVVLGLVFAVAAAMKMRAGRDDPTRAVLEALLPMLPRGGLHQVRGVILAVELILAYSLIIGMGRSSALAGTVVLLFVFTCVLVFLSATQGFDSDCGCFGRSARPSGVAFGIWRNVFLMIVAAILLGFETHGVKGTVLVDMTTWDIGGSTIAFGVLVVMHRLALGRLTPARRLGSDSVAMRIGLPRRN